MFTSLLKRFMPAILAPSSSTPSFSSVFSSLLQRSVTANFFHTSLPMCWTLEETHLRGKPPRRAIRQNSPISGFPQIRGTVLKVVIRKPKKPNSANRKCVVVKLTNGKVLTAWIPGIGHNLQEHSQVLIEGGRKPDLIGVKVRVMRGKLDCAQVAKKTGPWLYLAAWYSNPSTTDHRVEL